MSETKHFCTFYLDGHFFGVEVHKIQEIIRSQPMTRVPLAPSIFRGLINLRGQIVTALDLRRRLELRPRPADQLPLNVVVKCEDGAISFLVDEIGDVVEVDGNSFETPPETLSATAREQILGVYKLKDRLLLHLDTESAASGRRQRAEAA